MRRLFWCLFLLLAVKALADEFTASAVISALKLGATPEAVIAQLNRPANTVAPLSQTDIAALKAANVPEDVIRALVAKAPAPAPTAVPPTPGPTAIPAPEPPELTVGGLVLHKPFTLSSDRPGRLSFSTDKVKWTDALDPKGNIRFKVSDVKEVWLTCRAKPTDLCFQLNVETVRGVRYRFQDAHMKTGSTEAIPEMGRWIKRHYPSVRWGAEEAER